MKIPFFGRKRLIAELDKRAQQLEDIVRALRSVRDQQIEDKAEFIKQLGFRVGMNPPQTEATILDRLDVLQRHAVVREQARNILRQVDWSDKDVNPRREEIVTACAAALEVLK